MIINHKGKSYEIINWDSFSKKVLFMLGTEIVQEIQGEAMKLKLFDTGRYIRGFNHYVSDGVLNIDNDADYAKYLEFGTFDFGKVNSLGFDTGTINQFKKKNLPVESRSVLPKGMIAFAPMRRVLHNQNRMDKIIRRVFR